MEFIETELTEEQKKDDNSCDSPLTCQLCEINELCNVNKGPDCKGNTYFRVIDTKEN